MGADLPPDQRPQCAATSVRTGERCKRRPHPGSTVCVKHGAGAPQVRAAAARRVAGQEALRVAEQLGIDAAGSSTDPAEALGEALIIAQHYLAVIDSTGDWRARLAALTRVESIAVNMLRAQAERREAWYSGEAQAREAAGRLAGAVLAAARRSVWAAAGGNHAAA